MIKLEINGSGNEKQLLKMLAWIEYCGNIGHTAKYLKVYIDGDGMTRWRFSFRDENTQNQYEKIRKVINEEYNKNGKDLDCVEL